MEKVEKIGIFLITILTLVGVIPLLNAQQEFTGQPMNASIQQPICIELSPKYAEGIFFTNETTIGVQYPITNVDTWNNATYNYNTTGGPYGTLYNVTACPGNTINISIYHCACNDLYNDTVNFYIEVEGDDGDASNGEGVGWVNGTTTDPGDTPLYVFPDKDVYQLIGYKVDSGESRFLRYWLDPYPDNAPTAIYSTTYSVRGEDYTQPTPTCSC